MLARKLWTESITVAHLSGDEIANNISRNEMVRVVDYQKEQFKRYLPDTPENRQKYVDDLVEKTGMSEADALKNYDFDHDWVDGNTTT